MVCAGSDRFFGILLDKLWGGYLFCEGSVLANHAVRFAQPAGLVALSCKRGAIAAGGVPWRFGNWGKMLEAGVPRPWIGYALPAELEHLFKAGLGRLVWPLTRMPGGSLVWPTRMQTQWRTLWRPRETRRNSPTEALGHKQLVARQSVAFTVEARGQCNLYSCS